VLLDPQTGSEVLPVPGQSTSGLLCMRHPWPGISRTVRGDHPRYLSTYMGYAGYYFTGDGATRDADGYFWITGRVDDVLNVSGHRLGSAELEAAINAHAGVAESAVMGFPHEIKGEGIAVFVILKQGVAETPELVQALRAQVRQSVGAFAVPDHIIITPGLPKTRSGKIMRRILRKILAKESDQLGDISTLAEPGVVDVLVEKVTQALKL
jgi:acetyl-CoA synthetase